MKGAIAIVAGFLAAGCAGPAVYQPSPGAPTATLTFDRGDAKAMVLNFYTNGANCTDKRMLPGGSAFWEGQPVTLEAGREYAFGMFTIVDSNVGWMDVLLGLETPSPMTCDRQILSFRPQANTAYKLRYRTEYAERECNASLALARVGLDGREVPEPSFRQRQPIKTDGNSVAPECAP